jgi:ribosomal protein S18 acetylase RimI-like enzyme
VNTDGVIAVRHLTRGMMGYKSAGSLSIRDCQLQDVEAVLELWRLADATPSVTDTADDLGRAVAESPAHVLVAEVGGRIVGSIIGVFDGWRGNIYRLAVHPDLRRQGVARALVVEVEKRLTRQGAKRITALVEKDCPWAMIFWEAVGYQVDERTVRRVRTL